MNWTGHAFVDVGLAAVMAFCDKEDPESLTNDDFDKVAEWISINYQKNPLRSFLTVAFPNSAYNNPTTGDDKRAQQIESILFGHRHDVDVTQENCVFTGDPSIPYSIVEGQAAGYVYKQHIPLIMGEKQINFFPYGVSGLPISAKALICVQALPLGCAKVGKNLLAIHSSSPFLTKEFAGKFLRDNIARVQLAQMNGSKEMPASLFTLGTSLLYALTEILNIGQRKAIQDSDMFALTAYHFTNFGQSPEIAIYHLPLGVMNFLRRAQSAQQKPAWDRLVASAWQIDGAKPAKKNAAAADTPAKADKPKRNFLFEDVLRLPDDAARFLRIYFLRKGLRLARADDPRAAYTPQKDIEVISWGLTDLFLTGVMNMDKTRIEQIRQLGDRLAHYVEAENDRKFFQAFYGETNYAALRLRLVKADMEWVKRKNPPLITFDQYIEVFEEGEEIARKDWSLARDLALIRMIEQLHGNGWLARNQDAFPDETQPETA